MVTKTHRAISAANGTTLTTAAALITVPQIRGVGDLALTGRNFSTAVVVRYTLNPRLTVITTDDNLATFTDASVNAQDGSTSTDVTLDDLPANPTGRIYLYSRRVIRGFAVDMDATNVNTTGSTTMTGNYWNGSAFTDLSVTDGTSSATSLDQDGNVTWTVPTDEVRTNLFQAGEATDADWIQQRRIAADTRANRRILEQFGFWYKIVFNQVLSSAVEMNQLRPLNGSTNYAEISVGQPVNEEITTDERGISVVEALTDAGTANLVVDLHATDFV